MQKKEAPLHNNLAWPTVQRLSEYLIILEQFAEGGREVISSSELAEVYSNTPSQVRQDIFRLPNTGRVGQGYRIKELAEAIRETLGLDSVTKIVIVGCGRMGMTLAQHIPFGEHGMKLCGIFDNDPTIIGLEIEGTKVEDVSILEKKVVESAVSMAVLCVPASVAQELADRLVSSGIKGILNLTRQRLKVPPGIYVQYEQIICSFMQLAYKCKQSPRPAPNL
ncbi:MAG: hypothetical protein A2020_13685 [Lentisphaerae bacterium GWF2_45_14]|nr:MAG: hypothetical protein A2020_13685 [Lentisphaerae bacterium GWF2_45_14]